jgi:hypothetical protein
MSRNLAVAVTGLLLSAALAHGADSSDEQLLRAAGIPVTGPGLLQYFRARTSGPEIDTLVRQLGDKSFRTREKAFEALSKRGPAALAALRRAARDPDPEIGRQARACIAAIERKSDPGLTAAALRLLGDRKPDGAAAVLLAYLPSAEPDAHDPTLDALLILGVRAGKVDPVLAAALTDPEPERRAAAALVIGRSGTPEQRAAVGRLLKDANAMVRLRAAQGLTAGGDRTAIPVLVALVGEGDSQVAEWADDLLSRLAGEQAPKPTPGTDAGSRRKRRAAWEAWWQANETKLDLAHLGVDLALSTSQAREVARRFVAAFMRGDAALFARTTDVPFLLGSEEFRNREGLQTVFPELHKEITARQLTLVVKETGRIEDYARTMRLRERDPILKLRRPGVTVVYVEALEKGKPTDRTALFIRTGGGPPRVIGMGEAR